MLDLVGHLVHKDYTTQLNYMTAWSKSCLDKMIQLKTLTSTMSSELNTSISRTSKSRQSNQQPHPPVLAQVERQTAQPGNEHNSCGQGKYKKGKVDPLVLATNFHQF